MIGEAGAFQGPVHPKTFGMTGCTNCILFGHCGGHPLPIIRAIGCVNYADHQRVVDTDDMSPLFPDRFWELWDDVSGLSDFTIQALRCMPSAGLPRYLPLFQSRHIRRSRIFEAPIVALRLFDVVGKRRNGSYAPKYSTGAALRAAYKLRNDAQILLIGVDEDVRIENFWAEHREHHIGEALAVLGLLGVTVPNFSYFTCVPRFQILRNRKRILLSAERLSNAGVPVAIHLNANSRGDWDFWERFLQEHPEVATVTMEFQTGTRANEEVGREAFDAIVTLQDNLGRPLHPLLIGAGRYYKEACERLSSFTVIDSQPFMQALARQVLMSDDSERFWWEFCPTAKDAPLDDLIETTLRNYERKLLATPNRNADLSVFDPKQALFVGNDLNAIFNRPTTGVGKLGYEGQSGTLLPFSHSLPSTNGVVENPLPLNC